MKRLTQLIAKAQEQGPESLTKEEIQEIVIFIEEAVKILEPLFDAILIGLTEVSERIMAWYNSLPIEVRKVLESIEKQDIDPAVSLNPVQLFTPTHPVVKQPRIYDYRIRGNKYR